MDKIVSLCKNYEFQRAYTKGKSFVGSVVVTYVRKNRTGVTQVGITTSKKIGNAVMRNRSRRVIREAFRQLFPKVAPGYDLVFVARGKTPFCKSSQVREQLQKQLSEAGVLQPGQDNSPAGKMR